MDKPLRFHWRLPFGGETSVITRSAQADTSAIGLPDLDAQVDFCRAAEEAGIDSLLTDFGFAKPDPILLAASLGIPTEKIKFIIAYRSGLMSPATFVQQLNTLSTLIEGRFSLNIVAGYSPQEQRSYGDFLSHDERYERTTEFLSICRSFWTNNGEVSFDGKYYRIENGRLGTPFVNGDRTFPEILVSGSSPPAKKLAIECGTCWMRLADTPDRLRSETLEMARHVDVGLRLAVIARPTREEAMQFASSLIDGLEVKQQEKRLVQASDSVSIRETYELADTEWLSDCMWTGAVRAYGPTSIALVGSSEEVASAFIEYKRIGVSQFILAGWPKLSEMVRFGREVLPLIRQKEAELDGRNVAAGTAST